MARVRVRQHVNPLSLKYQHSLILPDWSSVYCREQPLHLDLGSARGKFLLQMAQLHPHLNFLGIEIREPLVIEANQQVQSLGLSNIYFLFANANNDLANILGSLSDLQLLSVTIQFPDPWFKKRHSKRRLVQSDLVQSLAHYLAPGGWVLLQSDVESIILEMAERFQHHGDFVRKSAQFLDHNPLQVPTEREIATLAKGEKVYRLLFEKKFHT